MNKLLIIGVAIVLVAPSTALADKKKANTSSGKDSPTESISLSSTKIQNTYSEQRTRPTQKSGINGGNAGTNKITPTGGNCTDNSCPTPRSGFKSNNNASRTPGDDPTLIEQVAA